METGNYLQASGLFMFVCPFVLLMFVLSVLFQFTVSKYSFVSSNSSYYTHSISKGQKGKQT
jgi:hypothetical protein